MSRLPVRNFSPAIAIPLLFVCVLQAQTQDFFDISSVSQAANGTPYFLEVEAAFHRGLTSGAGVLSGQYIFLPNNSVTRGEAAVFVVRGIFAAVTGDGENFTPPPQPLFTDVSPLDGFYPYIQEMAFLGITGGCTGTIPTGTYCENRTVTHEELAAFLVRAWMVINAAKNGNPVQPVTGQPAPCFDNYCFRSDFSNISSSDMFYPWIETAYFLMGNSLTATCGSQTTFCKGTPGSRLQTILDIVDGAWNQQPSPPQDDVHVRPIVSGISPASGPAGAAITITGAGFGSTQGSSAVAFNGVSATQVLSWGGNTISVRVPSGATSGPVTVTGTMTGPGAIHTVVTSTSLINFTVSSALDYTINMQPSLPSFAMPAGGGANFITFATPIGGFTSTVGFSASATGGISSVLTSERGANSFANVGGEVVSLDAQTTPPGTYSLLVSGNAAGIQHQTSVPLTVVPAPAPVGGIAAPSALQTNIGWLPLDIYDSNHAPSTVSTAFALSCPGVSTVRGCYQAAFANFHLQHVTGVRFFLLICGGFTQGTSVTALHNCGQPWQQVTSPDPSGSGDAGNQWIQNLSAFYQDLAAQQIHNVIPTMIHGDSTGSQMLPPGPSPNPAGCPNMPAQMLFNPGEPFAEASPGTPYRSDLNYPDYNCAPSNPIFVGWRNLDNVAAAVIRTAFRAGVNIFEFDLEQELNIGAFPVQARFIYDNAHWQTSANPQCCINDELANIQNIMNTYYRQNPNVVTWSAPDTQRRLSSVDCADVYGGFARLMALDEIAQVINQGYFGLPFNPTVTNGLYCGGTLCSDGTNNTRNTIPRCVGNLMPQSPAYHPQPAIVDLHTYPCLADSANGGCVESDAGANVLGEATNVFNAGANFLSLTGNQSATFVVGETHTTANNGCVQPRCPGCTAPICSPLPLTSTCDLHAPMDAAWLTVQGFNQSNLAGHSVVFRPFLNLPGSTYCYFSPANQRLNPGNQGPFSPSQQE